MATNSASSFFARGSQVELVQGEEVIDVATVVNDNRSRIILKSQKVFPGEDTEFLHQESGKWRMIFEGPGGERWTSSKGPDYIIRHKAS